jgi:endonuclease/exonuclease/phosphatase (EEP) superfamily protein YafD
LRIVSWNVAGLDERELDERTEAQCLQLLLHAPERWGGPFDAISLQEVIARTWHAHWRPHLAAAGYRVFPADPTAGDSTYFALLAVRDPAATGGDARFPGTRMGRRLVWAETRGTLVLGSHLESTKDGAHERQAQVRAIGERMVAHAGPAVFAGDTNLRASEEGAIHPELVDAWVAAGSPPKHRKTWTGGTASARFDRLWLRGLSVTRFEALPVALSDHLPLAATLQPPAG